MMGIHRREDGLADPRTPFSFMTQYFQDHFEQFRSVIPTNASADNSNTSRHPNSEANYVYNCLRAFSRSQMEQKRHREANSKKY